MDVVINCSFILITNAFSSFIGVREFVALLLGYERNPLLEESVGFASLQLTQNETTEGSELSHSFKKIETLG
jgi:hypothetical protein